MRPTFFCRGVWLTSCLLLAAGPMLADSAAEDLLTDAELAAMERENGMWRLANPDQGLAANVTRLKQAGYTDEEIAALQPRLAAMWTVPFERNFGWLRPEAVEKIRAIDHEFVARMRAVQLYERTGVRTVGGAQETAGVVNRLWRVAIIQALSNDELAEFQLMNSTAARQESRFARGLALTADEQRTLFEWRRDYDGRHGLSLAADGAMPEWQREMFLDHCRRLRDLLGDFRFAVYLGRANPGFDRMQTALVRLGETNPKAALDLWWLRQKELPAIDAERGLTVSGRIEKVTQLRDRAALMLGERLTAYVEDADGRWLNPNPIRRVVKAPTRAREERPPVQVAPTERRVSP